MPRTPKEEKDHAAYPALVHLYLEALGDEYAPVRQHAAQVLGNFGRGAQAAIPALRKALWDRNPGVSQAAVAALEKINGAGAVGAARNGQES